MLFYPRAPEILTRNGHGKAVDWWSLGTLMYDMLTGLVCIVYIMYKHKVKEYCAYYRIYYLVLSFFSHHLPRIIERKRLTRFYVVN